MKRGDLATMSLHALKTCLEAYGYRLDKWAAFERGAPAGMAERAREYLAGQHDAHVIWDPESVTDGGKSDGGGWLLVSSDPLDIAQETCRMIADCEPESGPLSSLA